MLHVIACDILFCFFGKVLFCHPPPAPENFCCVCAALLVPVFPFMKVTGLCLFKKGRGRFSIWAIRQLILRTANLAKASAPAIFRRLAAGLAPPLPAASMLSVADLHPQYCHVASLAGVLRVLRSVYGLRWCVFFNIR